MVAVFFLLNSCSYRVSQNTSVVKDKNKQQKFLKFPNFQKFIEKFVSRITMASGAGQRVVPSQAPVQALGPNTNIVNRGQDSALLRPSIKTSVTGEQTESFETFENFSILSRSQTNHQGTGVFTRNKRLPPE